MSPIESIDSSPAGPLVDLPLRSEALAHGFAFPLAATAADSGTEAEPPGATLASRAIAFAADLAGASLAVTLALLGAVAATGRAPSPGGLPWVAAFGLGFSFVFVVLPLTLFGRTVGMSLAGLAARAGPSGRRLTTGEAARRWAGTAMTALALGLPLLFTARDPLRPTPADRMSGRTLARDIDS